MVHIWASNRTVHFRPLWLVLVVGCSVSCALTYHRISLWFLSKCACDYNRKQIIQHETAWRARTVHNDRWITRWKDLGYFHFVYNFNQFEIRTELWVDGHESIRHNRVSFFLSCGCGGDEINWIFCLSILYRDVPMDRCDARSDTRNGITLFNEMKNCEWVVDLRHRKYAFDFIAVSLISVFGGYQHSNYKFSFVDDAMERSEKTIKMQFGEMNKNPEQLKWIFCVTRKWIYLRFGCRSF